MRIETESRRHLSMLRILYGACATALEAFSAADNPVDKQLVADLEKMVARTELEIDKLAARLAKSS